MSRGWEGRHFRKYLYTCWYSQESLGEKFEAELNSANPGVPAGRVLDLDSEDCIRAVPEYLAGVEDNETSPKF